MNIIKNVVALILVGIVCLGLLISALILLSTTGVVIKYLAGYEITHWGWNVLDTVCLNIVSASVVILYINYIRNKYLPSCKEE